MWATHSHPAFASQWSCQPTSSERLPRQSPGATIGLLECCDSTQPGSPRCPPGHHPLPWHLPLVPTVPSFLVSPTTGRGARMHPRWSWGSFSPGFSKIDHGKLQICDFCTQRLTRQRKTTFWICESPESGTSARKYRSWLRTMRVPWQPENRTTVTRTLRKSCNHSPRSNFRNLSCNCSFGTCRPRRRG